MKNFREQGVAYLMAAAVFVAVGGALFFSVFYARAGVGPDLSVLPKVGGVDNVIGATSTAQWVFNVTTTAELAPGDIIKFTLPTTTGGVQPFAVSFATLTAQTNINLFKVSAVPVPGVSSTNALSGEPIIYGYVQAPVPTGTAFSVTLGGINNANGPTSSLSALVWTVEAGTLSFPDQPLAPYSGPAKFSATSSEGLVASGGGEGGGPTSTPAVSNVALADNDTTGFGLDGRDFSVSWTPTGTQPSGYQFTQIYVVSSTAVLTTSNINTVCGGPCQPVMMLSQFSTASTTVPQFMFKDSAGANWATSTSYVAWVFTMAGSPSIVSSSPATSSYDNVADTNAPQIDHTSAHIAKASATATLYAFVLDDQTNNMQFASTTDGGAEYFKLYYSANDWAASSSIDAVAVAGAGELMSFTIPVGSVPADGGTIKYYLKASDSTGNTSYFCADPSAGSAGACQTAAFQMHTATIASSVTVTGTVSSNQVALSGATVFAGGFAGAAVTTNGSGLYTMTGLPQNDGFNFTATKIGYTKANRPDSVGTADKGGVDLFLNEGNFGFFMGDGGPGGGGAPRVMFSGPPDGMQGFPLSEPIRVGFNQPMDASTIDDSGATNTLDHVYLTTDGSTVFPGSVTYCTNNTAPGCSALFSMDQNVILFSPSGTLATGTAYTLVMTEQVKSQGGQTIDGNRPGGGHKITFTTMGNQFDAGQILANFGQGGQFMPPFVRSVVPAPGMNAAPNAGIIVEFSEAMQSAVTSSIQLYSGGSPVAITVTLDSNERRFATIAHSNLSAGSYEVRVLGSAANASGMPMRQNASDVAFRSSFNVSGGVDNTAPTAYSSLSTVNTGIAVNSIFEVGFSEQLSYSTVSASNITLYSGGSPVGVAINYDPGKNSAFVAGNSVLTPNTQYTLTFGAGITDLAANPLATTTYSFTTGVADTSTPQVREARCDNYTCSVTFNEAMNHDTVIDSNWVSSTLNSARFSLTQGGPNKISASTQITYDAFNKSITMKGVGLTTGVTSVLTISGVTDISGNTMANYSISMETENSQQTFGSFGDMGMFGPPTAQLAGGAIGGEFTPMGFGNFTADQFAFGQADMAFPFNQTSGQDSNVFQLRLNPGVALVNGDKVVITFPDGTNASAATADTFSPFSSDANGGGAGTVAGTVSADSATQVTITLAVSGGSPGASDQYTFDLRKIVNPAIPKGPNTGGYTVSAQFKDSGLTTVKASKTSMPYYINAGGTNTLTINVVAGSATSSPTSGANGSVFLHGGGPAGPMDKSLTLTNGTISAVDGSSTTSIRFSNLNDGCYFFGTDPLASLGGDDYFGQMSPEPTCVSGGGSVTKYLLLTPSSAGDGSITTTIKFAGGVNFGGADIDIFASNGNKFVVKTLGAVGVPNPAGYAIKLPGNGNWRVGVGPSMPKGASASKPASLPGVPPAPIELVVTGLPSAGAVGPGPFTQPGSSFDDGADTVTFTFATADKTVAGSVKDAAGNGLGNIEVFLHRQGFGLPVFGTTNASGTFSLSVSDYGSYEIGAHLDGLPDTSKQLEVRNESGTKVYVDGKLVSGGNPLVLIMKKAAYTISGKVLDASNNGIGYAPVSAVSASGTVVFGQTGSDGSYSLYVDNGTWTVKSELPPSKSDSCGSYSTTVTVSGSSQSSQNISPSTASCSTLSGSVTVGGTALANAPLFIEQWNTGTNSPVPSGMKKQASTDSNGAYSVKVATGTYRIGTWSTSYGELSTTTVVAGDTTANLTVGVTKNIVFSFTGGTSTMNGFLEVKDASDTTKRQGKPLVSLNTTTSVAVPAGTYNYFVDVFGVGKYSGTTTVAGVDVPVTVNLGVSANAFVTITGTIYDSNSSTLPGALVTFKSASGTLVQTAVADANGDYAIKITTGTYSMSASLANHLPVASSQDITFNAGTTSYDFGGSGADQSALAAAAYTVEGTVSSSAGLAMTDGFVWAENASGTVVTAPVGSNGAYSLPVSAGNWTIYGAGPLHGETTSSFQNLSVSGDMTGKNFALVADATRVPTSTLGVMAANAGGSVNDSAASGIKFTAGQGVLEAGSNNVNVTLEKSYSAPTTDNYKPLANASFSVNAQSNSTIKDLNGNAELQLDYSSIVSQLPSDISEGNLKLMYFSPATGDYVPVEGGFTVDAANNTITGLTNHLTDFVIAYVPTVEGAPTATTTPSATAISSSRIDVSWNAVSGATYYDVHRSTSLNGTYVSIATTTGLSYNNTTGLTASTPYYYKITVWNGVGEGPSSDAATATTSAATSAPSGGGASQTGDVTAPYNTSVIINSGASTTLSNAVTLTLAAQENSSFPIAMIVSNNSNFSDSNWETYVASKSWVLTPGVGLKTVYVRYRDSAYNLSAVVNDTIELLANYVPATSTLPVVSATTSPAIQPVETTISTTPAPVITITNPDSLVVITAPADLSFQPGEKLAFTYRYTNETGKSLKIRVTRELLFQNKVIKRYGASRVLKAGATFKGDVKETIVKTWKPGAYTERIKILDTKNKVLAENGLNFTVEKLKRKYVTLGSPINESPISFDAKYLGKMKDGKTLPTTLLLKYSYVNLTGAKQTLRLVRELVDGSGKVLTSRPGRWVMTPREKDSLVFTVPLTNNYSAGTYQIRLRAYNYAGDKALVAENSLPLTIELK